MDKQKIIEAHQKKEEKPLFKLKDGGVVVGEVGDEQNSLHYVIRRGKEYTVESAWNQPIVEKYFKITQYVRTTDAKGKVKKEFITR